jgi:DNA-binding LacI/PurR family transcriptional regulator
VIEAIAALEYRPNVFARGLVTNRTSVIGVLARDLQYIHARIIEGIEIEARNRGYQVFISGCEHNHHGEPIHSPLLHQQRIEGLIIVYQGSDRDNYGILKELGDTPVVSIGYAASHPKVTQVSIENRKAARAATQHLISLGHRRICSIAGPAHYYDSKERRRGYLDALEEAGIAPDEALMAEGDWYVESGYAATREILKRRHSFSAVFAQDDMMAIGCIQALRERDIRVPDEVAVVGFDNLPPVRYIEPALTTVNYPGRQVGRLCVRNLLTRIEEQDGGIPEQDYINISAELIVRRSCGSHSGAANRDR